MWWLRWAAKIYDFKDLNKGDWLRINNVIKISGRASKHAAKFVEEDHLSEYKWRERRGL